MGRPYVGFWGSVGMGILWRYPQDFLWVWDGYGDRNSVPTAALVIAKFHYTGLTGPDSTGQSADFVGDPVGTRGLCPAGSGLISSFIL